MHKDSFEAIGTKISITIFDDIEEVVFRKFFEDIRIKTQEFDSLYSRFKSDSLVCGLSQTKGICEVPSELVEMLRIYTLLNQATDGKINPAIGFTLSDTGYDKEYSLSEQSVIRDTPVFSDVITIKDNTHVEFRESLLLDLGALGKGYLVDILYDYLKEQDIKRFLIDGSGDIRYFSDRNEPIICGLEHPLDTTQAIGTLSITGGALCASATNRRRWGSRNHYLDPYTKASPQDVVATWVYTDTAALADGLSSALFFVPGERLSDFSFEYLVVNSELQRKNSAGFKAEFFS